MRMMGEHPWAAMAAAEACMAESEMSPCSQSTRMNYNPQFHENINISQKQEENRPYVETHLRKHSRKIGTG